MKRVMVGGLVAMLAMGACVSAYAQATKEKEGITVIREGEGGDIQIIKKERETSQSGAAGAEIPKTKGPVVQDDTPRKARVMVAPAVWQREYRRRLDRELNEKWGITDTGILENPSYTSCLVDALVNARKFDMLEREDIKTLIKELDFGETDYADVKNVQRIGKMAGADYVLIPEIRYLETAFEEKSVPYVGGKQVALTCKLATTVRTVDVGSGRIIASNISETEQKTRLREEDASKRRLALIDLISATQRESALKEAANIVDVAYPIRIMSLSGDTVMINRGKGAVNEGELFNVYSAGEVMVDPDTKENLGYQEALVGKIQVTQVNLKTSQAAIVEKSADIRKLYVCRRLTNEQKVRAIQEGATPPPKID